MLAPDQAAPDFSLPALDIRGLGRRVVLPAAAAAGAVAFVVLAAGHIRPLADAVGRALHADPTWALVGVGFECLSLAGYIALLSLVAGRATPRVGMRESAQITLAGAAATRLLPTAGAGGAALAVWTLRRAGLRPAAAARTLLTFFALLYSVFLTALAAFGAVLVLGAVAAHGPAALSAIPAGGAALAVVLALGLAWRSSDRERLVKAPATEDGGAWRARLAAGARLVGLAVRDALALVRARDPRLAGAAMYWAFDAAVLAAMLHAFGSPPPLPVIGLAYLVGQVANTVPLPGSVSGGMAGVLVAFGVPLGLALPAVLAYRTIAVWLPTPAAIAAIPGLRATVARWARSEPTAVL